MTVKNSSRWRRVGRMLIVAAIATAAVAVPVTASADVPDQPATAFSAPLCAGTTLEDPRNADGPVSDLSQVFGQRLTDYNDGRVVALYDTFGYNDTNAYPPVCGTRYVEGVGPVSEWMFCTDYFSHVCSGTDAEGRLLGIDGTPIPGLDTLADGNPGLTHDQEKLVAYLITHGHAYDGVGYFDFGVDHALRDGSSFERAALQVLVWCISNPVDPSDTDSTERERAQTCENTFSAADQQALLAQIPDDPTLELSLTSPTATLEPGATATVDVTTNIFGEPIDIALGGVSGTLSVLSGSATIDGTTLTVDGAGDGAPVTVTLGFVSDQEGSAEIALSAAPVLPEHLRWNQSPGVDRGGVECQIFATFDRGAQVNIQDSATVVYAIAPTNDVPTEPTEPTGPVTVPTEAPSTGPSEVVTHETTAPVERALTASGESTTLALTGADSTATVWSGAALLAAGLVVLLVRARRARSAR